MIVPETNDSLPVVLVTDEAYSAFAAVACLTLLESCERPDAVHLHLLHPGVSGRLRERLEELVAARAGHLHLHDIRPRITRDPAYRDRSAHFFRLLAPELLPPEINRFLYLDSDLLVYRDIGELLRLDLGDHWIAACRDYLGDVATAVQNFESLGLDGAAPYFNSGVMIVDRRSWQRHEVSRRVLECTDRNRRFLDAQGHFPQYDQYALNVLLHGRWAMLCQTWNYGVELPCRPVAIAHFSGHGKPWNGTCAEPYRKDFFAALQRTGWQRDELPSGDATALRAY